MTLTVNEKKHESISIKQAMDIIDSIDSVDTHYNLTFLNENPVADIFKVNLNYSKNIQIKIPHLRQKTLNAVLEGIKSEKVNLGVLGDSKDIESMLEKVSDKKMLAISTNNKNGEQVKEYFTKNTLMERIKIK